MREQPSGPDPAATLERVTDGVVAFDSDFRYTYANGRASELLGVDRSELLGECLWDLFPETAGSVTEEKLRTAQRTQQDLDYERYNEELDRWFEVRVYADAEGLSVFFADVSERKRTELTLRERTRQLDALLEHTEDAVYLKDTDRRYQLVNDTAAALFGLDSESMIGLRDDELFDEDSTAEIAAVDRRILDDGERVSKETERYIDGERHVFADNKFPWYDGDGDIAGVMGVRRDVTARRARERELKRSETLFQNAQDALFLIDVDDDYRIERVNPSYETVTGLSSDSMSGQALTAVFGATDAAAIAERYDQCVETRTPQAYVEELSVPESGSYWETRIAPVIVDGEVDQIVGATRNVTEQRTREQTLRKTRNTFRAIIESSPDAIVMLDADLQVTLWNPAAEELFGWRERQIAGDRAPFVPDDEYEQFEAYIDQLDTGEVKRGVETVRRHRNGDRIPVRLSSAAVTVDEELVGYMSIYEDVSERRAYERRLERQRDNLEVLTQMLSHDVRNDLQVVSAYAQLLADDLDDDPAEYAEHISDRAQNAVSLTQSAGDLAKTMGETDPTLDSVPLRQALEPEIDELRTAYTDAAITVEGPLPRVDVRADRLLPSVFRNLLKNAVQHNDKPVAEVTVGATVETDTVVVTVTDNGPGIPESAREDIFGQGEKGLKSGGTGIGLYLVRTLLNRYGGSVSVTDSEPDGAVFAVEFPRA